MQFCVMSLLSMLTSCREEYRRTDIYPFRHVDFALPHLAVCIALAVGESLGFAAMRASALWPLAVVVLVVFVLVGYGWKLPCWPYVAVMLLGFTLALCSESRRARVFDRCDYSSSPLSGEFSVDGKVKMTNKFLTFDSSVDGVDISVMIRRPEVEAQLNRVEHAESFVMPVVGDIWRCTGWLERKPRDERRRRRLWVCGRGSCAERISVASSTSLGARLRHLREVLSRNIGYGLAHDPLAADLDRAMVLGERANIPAEALQTFVDSGTVHVFAISGLHVGVIAWMIVYLLMIVFFFPLRWVAIPLAPILFGYVIMIDAPPSAVRSAVMSVIYFSAPLFLRRSDSLVAWSVTFMVFHVLNPEMLMNVGSLLSFTVMLGILLYVRWAEMFVTAFKSSFGVTTAAWLSGVAIAAKTFERITLGGLFVNIVMVPLATLSVVLGFLGAVLGSVCPWLASHFNNATALLIDAMAGISWMAARFPYANLVVKPWPMWMCVAWYVGLVMICWLIRSVYLRRKQII